MKRLQAEEGCTVHLVQWETYAREIVEGHGNTWNLMMGADLVMGGHCLEWDFMYVHVRYSRSMVTVHRNPNYDDYKPVAAPDIPGWFDNLRRLRNHTLVWPDPEQMLKRGSKLAVLAQLIRIASTSTKTPYPVVYKLPVYVQDKFLEREGWVIKRSYSDGSQHVLFTGSTGNCRQKFHASNQETQTHYFGPGVEEVLSRYGVTPLWFSLPYIRELEEKGEIRMYFVGGRFTYAVWTRPLAGADDMTIERVERVTPLTKLWYV
jgi:hypothetical protein